MMMGLEVPAPGSSVFHARFSFWLQVTGRPLAELIPWPPGPRNCSQSWAPAGAIPQVSQTHPARRPEQQRFMHDTSVERMSLLFLERFGLLQGGPGGGVRGKLLHGSLEIAHGVVVALGRHRLLALVHGVGVASLAQDLAGLGMRRRQAKGLGELV